VDLFRFARAQAGGRLRDVREGLAVGSFDGVPQLRFVLSKPAESVAAVTQARLPSIQTESTTSRVSTRANVFDVPSAIIARVTPVRGLLGSVPQ
jgi:hypothetical protein